MSLINPRLKEIPSFHRTHLAQYERHDHFNMVLMSISLYIKTISYLKAEQIIYRGFYAIQANKLWEYLRKKLRRHHKNIRWVPLKAQSYFPKYFWIRSADISQGRFEFLNLEEDYGFKIDWQSTLKSRLWRYNLHYFQYLHPAGGLDPNVGLRLMRHWIDHNPPGSSDAWDPFPVSLRLVNWVKYLSSIAASGVDLRPIMRSAYLQTLWLERCIEYHLLGNHLFKNAKALFFAGVFFRGSDAERWLSKGLRLLNRETEEQILPDGGHFERSIMYHSMILEDCLDLLNILNDKSRSGFEGLKTLLSSVCQDMVGFLSGMLHPDGNITLFNDAAFGIELPPSRILAYASSLLQMPMTPAKGRCWSFPESGYFVIAPDDSDRMIIDCGLVGPDYQPGHAHCDTLSYELSLDGQRVIVDSGVYDYEKGDMRQYVRCTRAHNTVMIDGEEQSEIWGAFRVARRAKPIYASIHTDEPHRIVFLGAHDGYKRLSGKIVHERSIKYHDIEGWKVDDRIKGSGQHLVQSFIHIHPELKAVIGGTEIQLIDRKSNTRKARIVLPKEAAVSLTKGWYCPEFGLKLENDVILLSKSNYLPIEMAYRILKN